jgi:hypothetical protein
LTVQGLKSLENVRKVVKGPKKELIGMYRVTGKPYPPSSGASYRPMTDINAANAKEVAIISANTVSSDIEKFESSLLARMKEHESKQQKKQEQLLKHMAQSQAGNSSDDDESDATPDVIAAVEAQKKALEEAEKQQMKKQLMKHKSSALTSFTAKVVNWVPCPEDMAKCPLRFFVRAHTVDPEQVLKVDQLPLPDGQASLEWVVTPGEMINIENIKSLSAWATRGNISKAARDSAAQALKELHAKYAMLTQDISLMNTSSNIMRLTVKAEPARYFRVERVSLTPGRCLAVNEEGGDFVENVKALQTSLDGEHEVLLAGGDSVSVSVRFMPPHYNKSKAWPMHPATFIQGTLLTSFAPVIASPLPPKGVQNRNSASVATASKTFGDLSTAKNTGLTILKRLPLRANLMRPELEFFPSKFDFGTVHTSIPAPNATLQSGVQSSASPVSPASPASPTAGNRRSDTVASASSDVNNNNNNNNNTAGGRNSSKAVDSRSALRDKRSMLLINPPPQVGQGRKMTLTLTNPSNAEAFWRVEHMPFNRASQNHKSAMDSKILETLSNPEFDRDFDTVDDPSVFLFSEYQGLIPAETYGNSYVGKALLAAPALKGGDPDVKTITITFLPTTKAEYLSRFRFVADPSITLGSEHDIQAPSASMILTLRGRGCYDESFNPAWEVEY